jgi:hypothetical protein
LGRGLGMLLSCGGRGARSPGSRHGSRTASGNVSAANRRRTASAMLLPTALLRKRSHAKQN